MNELEELSLLEGLLRIVGVVLLYYAGTRGVLVLTRRFAGRWYRRALVSLSFAVLFAPSLAGVGHGGILPVPAWMVAVQYAHEGIWDGVLEWGLFPVLITWVIFFAVASLGSMTSKNKNNKVDTHGKDP